MSSLLLLIAISVVCLSVQTQATPIVPSSPSPILIVPGLTASQLYVTDEGDENGKCSTGGKSTALWIDIWRILNFRCLQRELMMKYNPHTNEFTNRYDGVTIEVPGFGDTRTVEYLTPIIKRIPYLKKFVNYFVARGYKRGVSIRAAPFDWRLAADMLQKEGYYDRVKQLVEDMYEDNGQQRVTIVGHSLGGPVSLYFLSGYPSVTQEWKDKYIHAFVPIAASWAGANQALELQVSGINFHGLNIPTLMVPVTRTFGSVAWMLPSTSIWGDTTIVSTPSRNYTANDFEQLFCDVGYEDGYDMYESVSQLFGETFPAPNVNTYCFYSTGTATPESFIYDEDFKGDSESSLHMQPTAVYGDGDGTVNSQSNDVCLQWEDMRCHYLFPEHIEGVGHISLATDDRTLAKIAKVVAAPENSKQ